MRRHRTPDAGSLLFLLLFLVAAPASAQHALVLSGGGARGLSHAGAIVALEELGYRPSFVAGTSMGAIVGALYAAGYPAEEIRSTIAGENWLERLAPAPVLVGATREARRPLLGFGISRGRFYGGFLSSAGINQRLIELLFDAGVRARNDFDDLPIPYRAVTADLSTGAELVIGRGDLPRAVRASMAVPGVFEPVLWDDRVLTDGGVANNLPVSVAREFSDEPVIAIDVVRPREEIEERGALDIGIRALRLLIENARPDSAPDILVRPTLAPGLSETYFPADAADLLAAGYAAVREQVPAVPRQPEVRRSPGPAPVRIGRMRIDGADPAFERLIRRIMGGAVREYDAPDIVRRTSALYLTGLFQAVWPRLEFDDPSRADGDSGDPTLIIDVTPIARTRLSGAANWDNDVGASAWLSLHQHASLNTPVEMRIGGSVNELGHAGSVDASFFSALVPGLLWNGGAHAHEKQIRLIADDTVTGLLNSRRAGLRLGAELHGPVRDWIFSTFVSADYVRSPGTPQGWAVGPFVRIARTPAPDRAVGVDQLVEAEARGGDLEYQRVRLRTGRSGSIGSARAAVLVEIAATSGGTPLDAQPAAYRDIAPWLPMGALRSRIQTAVGLDGAIPTILNGYLRVRLRTIAAADGVDAFGESDTWRLGGEVGAIWPTVLGPISAGAAAGQHAPWRFNLSIGTAF